MKKRDSNNPLQDVTGDAPSLSTVPIQKTLEAAGKIVAPSAFIAALLYYFGWARTNALYSAFGIDQSLLQFSTQDYFLRSIQITLGSISVLLMSTLGLIWGHHGLSRLGTVSRVWHIRIISLLGITGFALLIASYLIPQTGASVFILIPSFWTVGVILLVYCFSILSKLKMVCGPNGKDMPFLDTFPRWLRNWSMGLIAALLIVGIFSTASISAKMQGQAQAEAIKKNPGILPAITVYSQKPLLLEGVGITVEEIGSGQDTFHYKYQGLRFLVRSGGRYFLMPHIWENDVSYAIILAESDGIRIEVSPQRRFSY